MCLQVENFGRMRYERSRDALAHGRILTQRHEATNAEIAMAEGDRPLVGVLTECLIVYLAVNLQFAWTICAYKVGD